MSSPLRASSTMVAKILVGGGTRRPLDQPSQTTSSQASPNPIGSSRPSAGRARRRNRPEGAGDTVAPAGAMAGNSTVMVLARTLPARDCKLADRTSIPTRHGLRSRGRRAAGVSVRRQRNLIVDQRIERGLDVDLAVDHPGLLQRQPGGKNGFALRGADPA